MTTQPQPNIKLTPPKIKGVYYALMTQDGTTADPTAQVLVNTIGNIIWTRTGQGQYLATLTNAFPSNKTLPILGNTNTGTIIAAARSDNNTLYLDTSETTLQDGLLALTPLVIITFN